LTRDKIQENNLGNMFIKSQLLNHCQNCLSVKFNELLELIEQVENSLQSESKSTAGDKHETGRAMLQLEREKLGFQLKELENQQKILDKISSKHPSKIIGLGSVIETNQYNYFIGISAKEIEIQTKKYYCISLESPIGKALQSKKVNDEFEFNNQKIKVISIYSLINS